MAMSSNSTESVYWAIDNTWRIGNLRYVRGKGWFAELRKRRFSVDTADVFPGEKLRLMQLRVKVAERFGVVIPMKDKLFFKGEKEDGTIIYTV